MLQHFFLLLHDAALGIVLPEFYFVAVKHVPYLKNDFEGDLEWRVSVFKSSWTPNMSSHYGIIPCAWEVPLLLRWKFVFGVPEVPFRILVLGQGWGGGNWVKGAIKPY